MGLILDTCVIIQAEKKATSINFDQWTSYENAYLTAITISELLVGVHRADSEARRIRRSAFVEAIINQIPVIDFTAEVARIHAEIYSYLLDKKQLIGAHDLIIAATALAHGCSLLTNNTREFKRIPGLNVLTV
jgi:tRNA(fMet)-specific endonuclease VapC